MFSPFLFVCQSTLSAVWKFGWYFEKKAKPIRLFRTLALDKKGKMGRRGLVAGLGIGSILSRVLGAVRIYIECVTTLGN